MLLVIIIFSPLINAPDNPSTCIISDDGDKPVLFIVPVIPLDTPMKLSPSLYNA